MKNKKLITFLVKFSIPHTILDSGRISIDLATMNEDKKAELFNYLNKDDKI